MTSFYVISVTTDCRRLTIPITPHVKMIVLILTHPRTILIISAVIVLTDGGNSGHPKSERNANTAETIIVLNRHLHIHEY